MAKGFYSWSQTASSNGSADDSVNYLEGQAPSSLNDSARAAMARLREWGNDISGAIVTSGTSAAYTVASNQVFDTLAHLNNQIVAFTPHTTNGAIVTLNVDGLGAKPLRTAPNTELLAGVLIQGTPYVAVYNNTDGAFYLRGFYGNPRAGFLGFDCAEHLVRISDRASYFAHDLCIVVCVDRYDLWDGRRVNHVQPAE